jgi:hypothetical protein
VREGINWKNKKINAPLQQQENDSLVQEKMYWTKKVQ